MLNGAETSGEIPVLGGLTKILVPVNGTEVARRAADFALALARAHGTPVKVLYVSRSAKRHRSWLFHQREEAVLKDVVELADRYGVRVETAMRTTGRPDDAICREANSGVAMIVMGVTQRPGREALLRRHGDGGRRQMPGAGRPRRERARQGGVRRARGSGCARNESTFCRFGE